MSKNIGIDPLAASVTRLAAIQDRKLKSSATGFFYNKNGRIFLVTNRHVLIDEGKDHYPEIIKFIVHINSSNVRENREITLGLYDDSGKMKWKEINPMIDVAAFDVTEEISKGCFVIPFSKSNFVPEDIEIGVGADVLVIGYPLGIFDEVFNLPVVRSAILATFYPVPFQGNPFFLVEARLHPGTSGSPIVTKPTNILAVRGGGIRMIGGNAVFLLGILSHAWPFIPEEEARARGFGPLDLNVAYFSSIVEDITSVT